MWYVHNTIRRWSILRCFFSAVMHFEVVWAQGQLSDPPPLQFKILVSSAIYGAGKEKALASYIIWKQLKQQNDEYQKYHSLPMSKFMTSNIIGQVKCLLNLWSSYVYTTFKLFSKFSALWNTQVNHDVFLLDNISQLP